MTFKLIEFLVTYKNLQGEVNTRYTYAENWKEAKRNWETSPYGKGQLISIIPEDSTSKNDLAI